MNLTSFGPIGYDPMSIRQWAGPHWLRHKAEAQELRRRGITVVGPMLDGPINEDWFGIHMLIHRGMMSSTSLSSNSYAITALEAHWNPDGDGDEAQFYDWHRFHDVIHSKIDRQLGIVTRQ